MEFSLREDGEGFSGGSLSINSFIKLCTYAGIFDNIIPSIVRMNNPIPSLTNVYLDTPLVVPTPDPLEYAPPPGRLSQTHGYPQTRTGGVLQTGASKILPPPHLHLQVHTLRCIPPLVGRNRAGLFKTNTGEKRGDSLEKKCHKD